VQYGKTEGPVNLVKALQRSNDIYFYKVGEWLGITKLADWAHRVGIGKPLGIELAGEAGGLMPDAAWKQAHFTSEADLIARNNDWYLGDTYHVAIGQGYLLVTPLQVNAWTNAVANGGNLCKPTIARIGSSRIQRDNCRSLNVPKSSLDSIAEGMEAACSTGGTGWPLFNFSLMKADPTATDGASVKTAVPVACKTGTAEFGDPKNRTHAWFTAFAPLPEEDIADDIKAGPHVGGEPEISVTVLVEGAGEGSNVAAPIAKKLFEEWFGR
jgi:penicillin-binding protein 2